MTEPIHEWFSLSYASYLTIPRSVLQSMPVEWQRRMVELLEEMERTCNAHGIDIPFTQVVLRSSQGRFMHDYLASYERGRRRLWTTQEPAD